MRRLYLEVYLVVHNRILFIAIVFKLPKQIVLPLFVGGGIDGGDNDGASQLILSVTHSDEISQPSKSHFPK